MIIASTSCARTQILNLAIGNLILKQVDFVKYLGVFIDGALSWNKHVDYITRRVRAKLVLISRLRPLPNYVLLLLYRSFVAPIFDYCDVVWHPMSARNCQLLEKLNSRITDVVPTDSEDCQYALYMSPTSCRNFHSMVQFFKIIHELSPSYLNQSFQLVENITKRISRNRHRIYIPTIRTNFGKNRFYYRGAVLWNRLKLSLYDCTSLESFKWNYKTGK